MISRHPSSIPPKRQHKKLGGAWIEKCEKGLEVASQVKGSPELFDAVLNDEGDGGDGPCAGKVDRKSGVESKWTRPQRLQGAIQRPLEGHLSSAWVWLHLLQLRLNEVEGQGEDRAEEASGFFLKGFLMYVTRIRKPYSIDHRLLFMVT